MLYATRKVGTAPGATTLRVDGLGLIHEGDAWRTGRPYGLPGTTALRLTQRDGRWSAGLVGADSGSLGIYVNEAQRSLTDVPSDFEAARMMQYLPVRQGWIYGLGQDAASAAAAVAAGDAEAVRHLVKVQRIQMILSVVSTLSIAAIATLAIARAIKARNSRTLIGE